jgi:16S rRNA (adenine1518-N6/adenine1519-N6)-dimethyltransferase
MSVDIIKTGASLTVFEIDPAYCDWLLEYLGVEKFKLVKGDVMKTWQLEWDIRPPQRVLGNLPYNTASAIIAVFIETGRLADLNVFTVQDEMGQRMTAKPGGKDYSSFSVLCQTGAAVKDGGRLSPGSFYPAPRVKSRIIAMKPGAACGEIKKPEQFRVIVRSMFSSRRKTLANNIIGASKIAGFPDVSVLKEAFFAEGIDTGRRPETVSPCEWVAVANRVAAN